MNVEHSARVMFEQSAIAAIIEDVSAVVERAPYICRCPARLFGAGLASELADAVDRLAVKVAELREFEDASR